MWIDIILSKLDNVEEDTKIRISDGRYILYEFGSDRGDYYDMYIGSSESRSERTIETVSEFKKLLNKALDTKVMTGYKGGEFVINDTTRVTIGAYGCCGDYISDVRLINGVAYLVYEQMQEVWN